jgi:hypothetical protein
MTIAEATWIATALLHRENSSAQDFSVAEIKEKAKQEGLIDPTKSGLQVHISKHCVANKSANPSTHRMLFGTATGRRRLFRMGTDQSHPDRQRGKIRPEKSDLPPKFQDLVEWYDAVYTHGGNADPNMTEQSNPTYEIQSALKLASTDTSLQILTGLLAKPLILDAAGNLVIPRKLLGEFGLPTDATFSARREKTHLVVQPITEDFIRSLIGSCKGEDDLLDARERGHRKER